MQSFHANRLRLYFGRSCFSLCFTKRYSFPYLLARLASALFFPSADSTDSRKAAVKNWGKQWSKKKFTTTSWVTAALRVFISFLFHLIFFFVCAFAELFFLVLRVAALPPSTSMSIYKHSPGNCLESKPCHVVHLSLFLFFPSPRFFETRCDILDSTGCERDFSSEQIKAAKRVEGDYKMQQYDL